VVILFCVFSSSVLAGNTSDSKTTLAVWTALVNDPEVKPDLINVRTNAGIVTLTGWVDDLATKERAGKIAESVRDVRSVVNQIHLLSAEDRLDKEKKSRATSISDVDT
jgi:osmotically-inducible protein OsmY